MDAIKKKDLFLLATTIAQNLQCPPNWSLYPPTGSCYMVLSQPGGYTFDQGNAKCKELGAQITSIGSGAEQQFVSALSNRWQPSGAVQTLIGGKRTGPKAKDWTWSDGTAWNFTAWSKGNPDNGGAASGIGQGCIQLLSSPFGPNQPNWFQQDMWDDIGCGASFQQVVCKTSAKSAAPCDADWTYSATLNNCYKVVVQPGGFSFAQGDATCKKLGAQLTSVHSDAENAFIAQIANSTTAAGGSQTLIGGQRTGPKAGDWKWSDGTAWDYSAWGTGNPDNGGAGTGIGQGCIQAFYSPYGPSPPSWYQPLKWDDRNCENFVNAVCKKPINK